jgi:hypothetical protein
MEEDELRRLDAIRVEVSPSGNAPVPRQVIDEVVLFCLRFSTLKRKAVAEDSDTPEWMKETLFWIDAIHQKHEAEREPADSIEPQH